MAFSYFFNENFKEIDGFSIDLNFGRMRMLRSDSDSKLSVQVSFIIENYIKKLPRMYQLNRYSLFLNNCRFSLFFPVLFLIALECSLHHGFGNFSYSLLLPPPLSRFATTMGRILENASTQCMYERLKSFTHRLNSHRMSVRFFVGKKLGS